MSPETAAALVMFVLFPRSILVRGCGQGTEQLGENRPKSCTELQNRGFRKGIKEFGNKTGCRMGAREGTDLWEWSHRDLPPSLALMDEVPEQTELNRLETKQLCQGLSVQVC